MANVRRSYRVVNSSEAGIAGQRAYWLGSSTGDKEDAEHMVAGVKKGDPDLIDRGYDFIKTDYSDRAYWGVLLIEIPDSNEWGECSP